MKERAKKILPVHLRKTISFDKLTNVIYAIACAIKTSMSKKSSNNKPQKKNGQIVKCKQQLRELRQKVARASHEIHRRKSKQKLTEKERSIMKMLR